jgi:hypothetical protein
VVHTLKTLCPYLLDKPFSMHTDNASLVWLQEQLHLSHHQARWLKLLAEYQYTVVHIPCRTNPADVLTCKRFRDGQGPALTTGHDESGSSLELYAAAAVFTHAGTGPDAPSGCFLHSEFAAALHAALPTDSLLTCVLGLLLAAAQANAPDQVSAAGSARPAAGPGARLFIARDGLLYRQTRSEPERRPLVHPSSGQAPRAGAAGASRDFAR